MQLLKYTLILFLTLPLYAASSVNDRRSKQVLEFFTKLEQGLFGEREFKNATKLLKRAKGVDRSWLVMALAQYERTMEKRPIEGLKILAPEVLSKSSSTKWLNELRTAESARTAEWRQAKADAYRKRTEAPPKPTGLAVELPAVDNFTVDDSAAQLALEVGRCLMDLGKIEQALKVIDHYGRNCEGDGRVLAFEALGDLYVKMRMFEKGIGSYKTGIKLLMANSPTEGLSKWQEIIKKRLADKLANAKKLHDIERYGPGYVAYRTAETKRRKEKLYLEAIWLYDQIIKTFPESVYSEASACYKLKCLLELATKKYPGKEERKTVQDAEKKLQKEKAFHKLAKRCKVPQASLDEIKGNDARLEAKLEALKAIPYGKKALAAAEGIAEAANKENMYGLYRGEMELALGHYALAQDQDVRACRSHMERLVKWCEAAPQFDRKLAQFGVPQKAQEVSKPPKDMKASDRWGNVVWTEPEIGAVTNRRTAPWIVQRMASEGHEVLGLCKMLQGDLDGAVEETEYILKHDKFERSMNAAGQANTYRRLKKAYQRGYIIASKDTLKGTSEKEAVLGALADFYFEREQWKKAEQLYSRLYLQVDGLRPRAGAYVTNMYAKCFEMQFEFKSALRILSDFDRKREFRKTPSWWQAKFAQAHLESQYGLQRGKRVYDQIIAQTPKEEWRRLAMFKQAQLLYVHGKPTSALRQFRVFVEKYSAEDPELTQLAQKYVTHIEKTKREGEEK